MSGAITGAWSRPIGGLLLALVTVGGVAGCGTKEATCGTYSIEPTDDAAADVKAATVLLIDVNDNSAAGADAVREAFTSEIETTVAEGGRLVARFSGGEGERVKGAECFSADDVYRVESANADAERRKRTDAVRVLLDRLDSEVRATKVTESGSPVRLLVDAHEEVGELQRQGVQPADISVVLYSDLLSVSSDCLNVNGVQGGADVAAGIVDRCFTSQELMPLPDGVSFTVRGIGDRAETSQQSALAGQIAPELCARMSTRCNAR
jgi:hypothetical protein